MQVLTNFKKFSKKKDKKIIKLKLKMKKNLLKPKKIMF